ncbi:MAG: HyaD/HybD family hydrogenase maturation endopeptidase [Erythrobacter sp.]|jgi:hydrogenase maturation protease
MAAYDTNVLILGIGNLLWADEGFGVRAVEQMHRHWQFPDNVRLLDGGTQGIYLVQEVREADVLVVFDAVDYNLAPGTLKRVEGDEVPRFLGVKKISLHQTGFQEVLAMAEMMGDAPAHQLLIGVQPVELEDYGGSLRPQVKAQIEPAISLAIEYLAGFGIPAQRRAEPLRPEQGIGCMEMLLERYEDERPTADTAARHGDERIISSPAWDAPRDFDAEMAALVAGEGKPR